LPVYSTNEKFLVDGTTEAILNHFLENNKPNFIASLNDFFIKNDDNKSQILGKDLFPSKIIFIGAGDIFHQAQTWIFKQQIQLLKTLLTKKKKRILFSENISAKKYNTLRIDAVVPLLIEPENGEILSVIFREFMKMKISFLIIGHGSNLLIDDLGSVLISLKRMPPVLIQKEGWIEVSADFSLSVFCKQIAKLGFQGCEELVGIPGTIGGALHMNAGTSQQTISDKLLSIDVINFFGNRQTIDKSQIFFTYRQGFRKRYHFRSEISVYRKGSAEDSF
jgi:hypothetical protein